MSELTFQELEQMKKQYWLGAAFALLVISNGYAFFQMGRLQAEVDSLRRRNYELFKKTFDLEGKILDMRIEDIKRP